MSTPKVRVAICGGGIGGLCLAVPLSKQAHIQVDVYEAAGRFTEIGAGLMVWARTWRIFELLGLGADFAKIVDSKPDPTVGFNYRRSDRPEGFHWNFVAMPYGCICFHRAHFLNVLVGHLPPGVAHFGKRLVSYERRAAGAIGLMFADGTRAECDVLVGCDGIKSVVRAQMLRSKAVADAQPELLSLIEPKWTGTIAYRGLVPSTDLPTQDGAKHDTLVSPMMYCGQNKHIVAYPISQGHLVNWVAFATEPEKENTYYGPEWVAPATKEEIRECFSDWEPGARTENSTKWGIHRLQPLPFYVADRVVLLGDAAHGMPPHLGAGAGQAIEFQLILQDAFILASVLAAAAPNTIDAAVEAYQQTRLPVANHGPGAPICTTLSRTPSSAYTVNAIRDHRIVVASLFLPSTAVVGTDSPISTPEISLPPPFTIPDVLQQVESAAKIPVRPSLRWQGSHAPAKSVVDDLIKIKSNNPTPAALTPHQEKVNPFSKLMDAVTTRKQQAAHTIRNPRVQQKPASPRSSRPRPSSHGGIEEWHIEHNTHCNGGLKNAIVSMGDKLKNKLWVGAVGTHTDAFTEPLRRAIDKRMRIEKACIPVWIPDAEFESSYDEFCHQVLWPCLHYAIPDAPKTKLFYETASFKQYVAVNQRFADAIIANYQDGDIIWIHDYHLMLLPAMLRVSPKIPAHAPIGFFMHVAFPSSEIFRCLSVRCQLLSGLLAANLIGFQTASYARHFRQTVSRVMAYEALPRGIQVSEGEGDGRRIRFVDVGVFPMGIDVQQLEEKKREPDVAEWVQVLKQRYAGMKILVGRDKLDEIQGVRHKLLAFQAFLEKHPEYEQKVVLIQVALQTRSTDLAGSIADVVMHINSRFSTLTYQPVVFLPTQDLTFSQYLALLTVADAFLVTSLREGMALRTHEFVECQEARHRPLILSEFTGSYSYSGFRSCIAINPWDTRGTASAIYQALTMSDDEALSRWEDLHNHVTTQTGQAFVTSFLSRCLRSRSEQHLQSHEAAPTLDMRRVLPRYKHSSKRLVLLDFEGTLWKRPKSGAPADNEDAGLERALELLRRFAADSRNDVWLLSGLPVAGVLSRIVEEVPYIGIVAENGCFVRPKTAPRRSSARMSSLSARRSGAELTPANTAATLPGGWINMVATFDLRWKSSCIEILNYFTERTPGSFVEERQASIVWRFCAGEASEDSGDRQWALRQAAEAQNHIFDSLGERYGLRIIPDDDSFLVLPNSISRSTAVGAIMHPGGPAQNAPQRGGWMSPDGPGGDGGVANGDLDLVLAVSGDEKLIQRLNELITAETVATGVKATDAKWKLDADKVLETLGVLASAAA
ncbi:glycosyltransferase family 20-domain-containing protein [Mycena maculata]|uniref:Glycosyltransferase family 20-domain-containing protein n=1 Tax=Mycena maculata TaxID=230809 RepID=A0AAD7KHJ5_9AGAR|nr:glycosyltransferase family 20-domain-containing protein [Mycena maculata]